MIPFCLCGLPIYVNSFHWHVNFTLAFFLGGVGQRQKMCLMRKVIIVVGISDQCYTERNAFFEELTYLVQTQ